MEGGEDDDGQLGMHRQAKMEVVMLAMVLVVTFMMVVVAVAAEVMTIMICCCLHMPYMERLPCHAPPAALMWSAYSKYSVVRIL